MRAMADTKDIETSLQTLLQPHLFKDYGPNGLQVEGKPQVQRLVSGVTASLACIEAAVAQGADALLVHHGLFWRGQDGRLTGWLAARVRLLMAHDINLLAYHLPLDAHAGERVAQALRRQPLCLPGDGRPLRRVAWCTGGAQNYFEAAIAAGADVFLTGEVSEAESFSSGHDRKTLSLSEPQAHLARGTGVAFLACGHHATERYGAQAVGAWLAGQWGLEHRFIDVDNPA